MAAEDKKPTILVVDDMDINRIMLESILVAYGADCELACDGDECINKCKEKEYDLIFLDNHMPNKDGYETLKELKTVFKEKNNHIPVVCYTAYEPGEGEKDYDEAGFDAVLNKPIESDSLTAILEKYLSSEYDLKINEENKMQKEQHLADEKSKLPSWLSEIKELDTDAGITACKNAEDYIRALSIFVSSIESKAEEIKKYLADDNLMMFTLRVHSLKSMARLIGAKKLSDLSASLEKAGKEGKADYINENVTELLDNYLLFKPLLEQLSEKEDKAENKILPPVSEETLNDAYLSMAELTYCYDSKNINMILDALSDYKLKDEDAKKVEAIRGALRNLDWEKMRNIFDIE